MARFTKVAQLGVSVLVAALGGSTAAEAKPLNPCKLVTSREVSAITHRHVTRQTEAPLGPTCIYKLGAHDEITLAIDTGTLSERVSHARGPRRVTVSGRRGYCVSMGRPTLYVELPRRRILDIAASCAVATRIAAKALSRIHT
jgi:hypothetical protein